MNREKALELAREYARTNDNGGPLQALLNEIRADQSNMVGSMETLYSTFYFPDGTRGEMGYAVTTLVQEARKAS